MGYPLLGDLHLSSSHKTTWYGLSQGEARFPGGTGQSAVQFVLPTVPVSSRPFPCTNILSGSLPELVVRAWSDLGSQYDAEISKSSASATVTSALAEVSQSEVDEIEQTILEIEEALKEANEFDEQDPSLEGLAEKDLDDDDSFDELSPGRYSRLESERKVEPRPVLATAKRVKE